MIIKIYTVYDLKAEAYLPPFFMQNNGTAIRSFADAVNKEGHEFNAHPEDYVLFEIGEYDDKKAQITQGDANIALGNAVEYLQKSTNGIQADLLSDLDITNYGGTK